MTWFHPTDKNLLFTKNDKEDPRLGECVQLVARGEHDQIYNSSTYNSNFDFAVIGYPDDEGISLNGGRVGAQTAPREIRTFLYKMTPHLEALKLPQILDLGNLDKEVPLEERHQRARQSVSQFAQNKKRWLSLGGGHDYGYADACGFLEVHKGDAVVINFDAHLDVRPTTKGYNSGTPFFRMLTEFKDQVDFAEVGIQNQCNSKNHLDWAKAQGAEIFNLEQVNQDGLLKTLQGFLKGKENKRVFLSVDIDAFTSSEAPGCSQSWTTGIFTKEFMEALTWILAHHDVRGLGIYEVSPPLDQDSRTSKLAALIAHKFIFDSLKKG